MTTVQEELVSVGIGQVLCAMRPVRSIRAPLEGPKSLEPGKPLIYLVEPDGIETVVRIAAQFA